MSTADRSERSRWLCPESRGRMLAMFIMDLQFMCMVLDTGMATIVMSGQLRVASLDRVKGVSYRHDLALDHCGRSHARIDQEIFEVRHEGGARSRKLHQQPERLCTARSLREGQLNPGPIFREEASVRNFLFEAIIFPFYLSLKSVRTLATRRKFLRSHCDRIFQ